MRRAERLLGACLLVALCGCAALQQPRHEAGPPAAAQQHPPTPPATAPMPPETAVAPEGEKPAPESASHAVPELPAARSLDLLHDAERFAGLPPDAQRQTLAEAETRRNVEQTPPALLRYALLLSLSDADRQAGTAAAAALRDFLAAPPGAPDPDLTALARVLLRVFDEREHLLAQNVELQRKLDQLKAIEQQLGDRDGADAPPIAP